MIVEGSGGDRTDQVRIAASPTGKAGTRRAERAADDAMYEAQFGGVKADRILAGKIGVEESIASASFLSGSQGWSIWGNGDAEFNGIVVRGTIEGSTITGGLLQTAEAGIRVTIGDAQPGQVRFYDATGGWIYMQSDGGNARIYTSAGGSDLFVDDKLLLTVVDADTYYADINHGHSASTSKVSTWLGGQSNGADKTGKNLDFPDGTHNHTAPDHQHTVTL